MISGGVAGSIGKTITAPLSRLTILYQVNPLMKSMKSGEALSYGNNLSAIITESRIILRDEGLLSFWRGNLTSVLHRFPYSAINFSGYEWMKRKIHNDLNYQENFVSRLICGAYAGGVACFAVYPLDLIRTQLSTNVRFTSNQNESRNRGWYESKIIKQMRSILKSEGIAGLYRGLLISMAVSIPNLAIGFAAYGSIKEHLLYKEKSGYFRYVSSSVPKGVKSLNLYLNNFGTILCGASAGIASSLVIFPLDVVRRRLQIFGAVRHGNTGVPISEPKQTVSIIQIAKSEGFKGFYRGILPELLKVVPMGK